MIIDGEQQTGLTEIVRVFQDSTFKQGMTGVIASTGEELGAASRCHPPKKGFAPNFSGEDYSLYIRNNPLDITPLGLYINFPTLVNTESAQKRLLLDTVINELHIQASTFSRRPIALIQWRNLVNQLSAAEITELMYVISRRFRLNHNPQREYCAEVQLPQVNDETLALLKGLGINQLLCCFNQYPDDTRQLSQEKAQYLQDKLKLLRDYDFNELTLQIVYGHASQDLHLLRQLLDQLITLRPARIQLDYLGDLIEERLSPTLPIAQGNLSRNQFMLIYNALRNAGYRVAGNDCFMLPRDRLAQAQIRQRLRRTCIGYNAANVSDLLGFGPTAFTQIGSLYTQNLHNTDNYRAAVEQRMPPVASGLELDSRGKHLRLVLDQLLCYHSLDINYLEGRYNFNFEAQFGNILAALCEGSAPPLMTSHNQRLNLTADGIVQLRAICQGLLYYDNPSLIAAR